MHPYKFGPPTPAFRAFAEQQFFGRYAAPGMKIQSWMPSELVGRHPVPTLQALLSARAAAAGTGQCALLAWAVHDLGKKSAPLLAQDLARAPGIAPRRVVMQTFLRGQRRSMSWKPTEDGFVFYVLPPAAPGASPVDPGPLVDMPSGDLGKREVVALRPTPAGSEQGAMDHFSEQTWSSDGRLLRNESTSTPRITCDPPMHAADDIRPDPSLPGCAEPAAH